MLAKLICFAETRDAAIARLDRALRDFIILGITTNISWLRRIVTHAAFREGKVSTRFLIDHEIKREVPDFVPQIASTLASATRQPGNQATRQPDIWETLGPWNR